MRFTRTCNGLAYYNVRHPLRPNLKLAVICKIEMTYVNRNQKDI